MKIGTINSVAHRVNFQRWGQIIKEFVFYTPVSEVFYEALFRVNESDLSVFKVKFDS